MPSTKKLLQAAAGNAGESLYVEDVFSTYLYAGTSASHPISNGIDLSAEGGMVWIKNRTSANWNVVEDTDRGATKTIYTNSTNAEATQAQHITSFNSDGFTAGTDNDTNLSGENYTSWTFRKAEKFFDVVYQTISGTTATISHNLGSTPGCIIRKRVDDTSDWFVWHNSLTSGYLLYLNLTLAEDSSPGINSVTDSTFGFSGAAGDYVFYIFAHDAGGFGDDGSESIIKCGSFTTDASGSVSVNLGFEPQWLLVKNSQITENWVLLDSMRGWSFSSQQRLFPNLSNAEQSLAGNYGTPTATGFDFVNGLGNSNTYIYIAIRRPMKTPESGTEVYQAVARTGTLTNTTVSSSFPVDLAIIKGRTGPYVTYDGFNWGDRLRGGNRNLYSNSTSAENTSTDRIQSFAYQNAVGIGSNNAVNDNSATYINYFLKRATGFFDVVAYTGTGVARTVAHNLGVVPELMIVKKRSAVEDWGVYTAATGNTGSLRLNTSGSFIVQSVVWNNTTPTSSVFTVGTNSMVNANTSTYIAYLFATLAGVSKVGSYTGTGSNVDVDCGFSAGARFILIKRTDDTGDWYVYDSARGIVAGNDPYFLINSTAAEVTSTDYIDPLSSGFTVTSSAPAALNASGGNYIFLAIA